MNAVMLAGLISTIVNAAAGNNGHICVIPDKEIIIDEVFQSALTDDDRNMNALVLGTRLDNDINARLVFFCNDINIGRRIPSSQLSVRTDVVSAFRNFMNICDCCQKIFLYLIHYALFLSSTGNTGSLPFLLKAPAGSHLFC